MTTQTKPQENAAPHEQQPGAGNWPGILRAFQYAGDELCVINLCTEPADWRIGGPRTVLYVCSRHCPR
jgi:hypothetical protein